MAQIFDKTVDITELNTSDVVPLGSTVGYNVACSIILSGFVVEDSTWEIVEYNFGTNGANEDYQVIGANFLGSDDVVIRTSATHYYSNLGLRLSNAGTETSGTVQVIASIK